MLPVAGFEGSEACRAPNRCMPALFTLAAMLGVIHLGLVWLSNSMPVHPTPHLFGAILLVQVVQVGIVPSVPNTRGHAACIRWHLRTIRCLAPVLPRSGYPPLLAYASMVAW